MTQTSTSERAALIARLDKAREAWLRQDAMVTAMRTATEAGPGDEVDRAMVQAQVEEQLTLAASLRQHVEDLASALERADGGGYGTCEACGGTIPRQRLKLFPAATRCVTCQATFERR